MIYFCLLGESTFCEAKIADKKGQNKINSFFYSHFSFYLCIFAANKLYTTFLRWERNERKPATTEDCRQLLYV